MGVDVMYNQDENVIGVFLEWDGNQGTFVIMKDESQIQLSNDGTGYIWPLQTPIVL